MKTIYVECAMGAAGDMLMAALSELSGSQDKFIQKMNALGLPGVTVSKEERIKCGISGTGISVKIHGHEEGEEVSGHHHDHSHSSMHSIGHIVEKMDVSQKVKADILAVYEIIGQAEAFVHKTDLEHIHFHEVGSLDAIADITGVCILMEEIGADQVIVSPIHTGTGQIKCAHGILPVPAPATARILEGVPVYSTGLQGELCTPTGAALLKYFAGRFDSMPAMAVGRTGYGMGKKDFEAANCVRAYLGNTIESAHANEEVILLSCNVDDMTGEEIGFASEKLFEAGALDVYITPIQMKKNRPGQMINCICRVSQEEILVNKMLVHTSTFGVRRVKCGRYALASEFEEAETPYGRVKRKTGRGYGIEKVKTEFGDAAMLADEYGISVREVLKK